MSLIAPIIAGIAVLVSGGAVLIWMNRSQPALRQSMASEVEQEPSREAVLYGRVEPEAPRGYARMNIHHE